MKRGYKIVASEKNQIRVLLSEEQKSVSLTVHGAYNFIADNEETGKLKNGDKLNFQINSGGIIVKFNSREIDGITFLLQPADSESTILFSGKKYTEDLLLVYSDNNKIFVINRLPMDDYLLGVLPAEIAVKFNQPERFEALKAFAVCARTFAEMKKAKGNTYFDITDDVRDQVFWGFGKFTELDKKAVTETSQEVLKYKEKLAEVFYHSACGGMLEDPANVFSGKVDDYLVTKKDGDENPNCEISPTFYWKESYTPSDLLKLLKAKNLLSKKQRVIKDIEIADVFTSGRVKELRINFVNADDVNFRATEIRNFFIRKDTKGILRSSLFTLSKEISKGELKKVTLNGKGSGHGVGLCQWGAMYLSSQGKSYNE
ncbi:MAG: SpoIID/LytB domain-containing protein, partial [Ignavibacteriaceae bacterium]